MRMSGLLSRRLFPILQLARMALVFTAISNSLCTLMLATHARYGGAEGGPLLSHLSRQQVLAVVLISTGLYGFGMSLNDIIDRRRDQQIAAHRPLPSGRIGVRTAHLICTMLLLFALLSGAYYAFTSPGDPRSFWIVVGTLMLIAGY